MHQWQASSCLVGTEPADVEATMQRLRGNGQSLGLHGFAFLAHSTGLACVYISYVEAQRCRHGVHRSGTAVAGPAGSGGDGSLPQTAVHPPSQKPLPVRSLSPHSLPALVTAKVVLSAGSSAPLAVSHHPTPQKRRWASVANSRQGHTPETKANLSDSRLNSKSGPESSSRHTVWHGAHAGWRDVFGRN